jgi:hypothetical protein
LKTPQSQSGYVGIDAKLKNLTGKRLQTHTMDRKVIETLKRLTLWHPSHEVNQPQCNPGHIQQFYRKDSAREPSKAAYWASFALQWAGTALRMFRFGRSANGVRVIGRDFSKRTSRLPATSSPLTEAKQWKLNFKPFTTSQRFFLVDE